MLSLTASRLLYTIFINKKTKNTDNTVAKRKLVMSLIIFIMKMLTNSLRIVFIIQINDTHYKITEECVLYVFMMVVMFVSKRSYV